jgi:hypothetical protein
LLTLAVSNNNPENRASANENTLYVADSARGVEVKSGNSWKKVEWATNVWGLSVSLAPGARNERGLVLVPCRKDHCRVWLKYAVLSLSAKGLLELVVTNLPLSIRSRIFLPVLGDGSGFPAFTGQDIGERFALNCRFMRPLSSRAAEIGANRNGWHYVVG